MKWQNRYRVPSDKQKIREGTARFTFFSNSELPNEVDSESEYWFDANISEFWWLVNIFNWFFIWLAFVNPHFLSLVEELVNIIEQLTLLLKFKRFRGDYCLPQITITTRAQAMFKAIHEFTWR